MDSNPFKKAVRSGDEPMIIGLSGPSWSGKTMSAMRLAAGISGDKPFCVIDTESGRARLYADRFRFDHVTLEPPFRPYRYQELIEAAVRYGYPVVVIDQMSAEHEDEGGLIDWKEEEVDRMAGKDADWKRRDKCAMAGWIKPKSAHKKLERCMQRAPIVIIMTLRAEQKVEMVIEDGKTKIVPKKTMSGFEEWIPVCEKGIPYILTASFMLLPDNKGVPHAIKILDDHAPLFPPGKQITEETGKAIAAWIGGSRDPGCAKLEACKTMEELVACWGSLTQHQRMILTRTKDAMKELLSAPTTEASIVSDTTPTPPAPPIDDDWVKNYDARDSIGG